MHHDIQGAGLGDAHSHRCDKPKRQLLERRMTAKTTAERKALERTRKAAQGLKEVRGIWLCPEDEKKLKEYAVMLQQVRIRSMKP
jgi:hypothetical protein